MRSKNNLRRSLDVLFAKDPKIQVLSKIGKFVAKPSVVETILFSKKRKKNDYLQRKFLLSNFLRNFKTSNGDFSKSYKIYIFLNLRLHKKPVVFEYLKNLVFKTKYYVRCQKLLKQLFDKQYFV